MTQSGSSLAVVIHRGSIVERVGAVQPDTELNLQRLRRFMVDGDGLNQLPSEEKDIIRGSAGDFQWLTMPFDAFSALVEQRKITVVDA